MASSALRRSLTRRGSLARALCSNQPPSASAAADGAFHRSFQSDEQTRSGETAEEFEDRLFGGKGSSDGSLFRKLDRVGNAGRRYGMGSGMGAFGGFRDRNTEGFNSLNDGLSGMLGDAAHNFQAENYEPNEWDDYEFDFRPDVPFRRGSRYNIRNIRFLSNFITEDALEEICGEHTCFIMEKQILLCFTAVAREIKTAHALGLMPFTTMGRRPFIFGGSAEEHHSEEEYGYDFVEKDGEPDEDKGAEPAVEPA